MQLIRNRNDSNITGNSLAYGFNSSLDALVSQAFGAKAPALAVSKCVYSTEVTKVKIKLILTL